MTQSSIPPSSLNPVDSVQTEYHAAADEFVALETPTDESDSEEEGESEGGDGKGGGGRTRKSLKDYEVTIDRALFDFSAEEGLEPLAALLDIMGKLKLAAPSEIIKGSSMMGPEHPDIALRELGLHTLKLDAKNIADPDLLKKLDQKQRELRQRENIPHPDDGLLQGEGRASAGGAIAAIGLVAATMADTEKPQERARQKRDDAKFEKRQEREVAAKPADGTFEAEAYSDDLMTPASEPDLSDIVEMFDDDLQFDKPEDLPPFADSLNMRDRGTYASGPSDLTALTGFFNYLSSQLQAPVERVDLSTDMRFERQEPVLPVSQLDL